MGCGVKSYEVATIKIGHIQECIFVLGKAGGLNRRTYVYSTSLLPVSLVTPSILDSITPKAKLRLNRYFCYKL